MKKVSFTVDGLKLAGTIFFPPKPAEKNPAILFVHGWTSAQERSFQYAKALAEIGYICMVFDMRGHGVSVGDIATFTPKDFLHDVLVAYDYLLTVEGVDSKNISGVGSSFGCYLVAMASEKKSFQNLALRVPADYPNDIFDDLKHKNSGSSNTEIVSWRKKSRGPNDSFALKAISKFKGNMLIIESEKDTVVPHETIANYINAVKNKKNLTHAVMLGAPHSLREGSFRDECQQILVSWFKPLKK